MKTEQEIRDRIKFLEKDIEWESISGYKSTMNGIAELHWVLEDENWG